MERRTTEVTVGKGPHYVYYGHHKCATTWIRDILQSVCEELDLRFHVEWLTLSERRFREMLDRERPDVLALTNTRVEYPRWLGEGVKGFHVVRDPRDVCVSGYWSHRNSHPTGHGFTDLDQHRVALRHLPREEGLLAEMAFLRVILRRMEKWDYSRPNVLEVRMEDLTSNPHAGWLQVLGFLGLLGRPDERTAVRQIPADRLAEIVESHAFARLTGGRELGKEDRYSHFRKGISGDWRNYFTPRHVDRFREKHNTLLRKLGYETADTWS